MRRETVIAESENPNKKNPPTENPQGESIWTLVSANRHWYFGFYIFFLVIGETVVVAREIGLNKGIIETLFGVFVGSAYVVTASTGLAFGLAEIARYAMVMAHSFQKWISKKFRESDEKFRNKLLAEGREEGRVEGRVEGREEGRTEGRQEGREEGRVENQQAWEDWYESWKDAQSRGKDFTKPPPNGKA